MVTGHRSPKCGGSHLVAFGAGGSPDARLTRQPRGTGHARGARVPGAASVTLAKRGDKAGTGRAGDKAQRDHSPLCHHQRHQEPARAPLTFCPFSPASPGLPWGNAGMSQAGASPPKNGHGGHGGHSPLCPGGHQLPFLLVAPALPPVSLSLGGLAGREGTARTARPAEGHPGWKVALGTIAEWGDGHGPPALPISALFHARSCTGLSRGGGRDRAGTAVSPMSHLLSLEPPRTRISLLSRDSLHRESTAEVRPRTPKSGSGTPEAPNSSCTPGLPTLRDRKSVV